MAPINHPLFRDGTRQRQTPHHLGIREGFRLQVSLVSPSTPTLINFSLTGAGFLFYIISIFLFSFSFGKGKME